MNYYIQGDAAKADKIKAAFEKLGYEKVNVIHIGDYANERLFFFTENGKVRSTLKDCGIASIIKTHPDYKELELPIEPKFKAEDRIVSKSDKSTIYRIIAPHEERREYIVEIEHKDYHESCPWIAFEDQDDYELVPKPHYDIANFKPFDKVLVRDDDNECWMPSLFGWFDSGLQDGKFVCGTSDWDECIPFNDKTKHLLGTTDMPSEEYINW